MVPASGTLTRGARVGTSSGGAELAADRVGRVVRVVRVLRVVQSAASSRPHVLSAARQGRPPEKGGCSNNT